MTKVAAVDVGASSGRVIVAELSGGTASLLEVARFPNSPRFVDGRWIWDVEALYESVIEGLEMAVAHGVESFGIDTWAVDYGVVRDGSLVGPVYAYRDPQHASGEAIVDAAIRWAALYSISGVQRMVINSINQIAADRPQRLTPGTTFLLVPDLLSFWATGIQATDVTNASTTGMLDVRTRTWSPQVLSALDLQESAFLPPDEPGNVRGPALDRRLDGLRLIGVATHDTASAFVGTPLLDRDAALVLSLGTWALIGAEVTELLPTPEAEAGNVTHELGVDGTVRFLRNVCGMWLLEECRRAWGAADGDLPDVADLLAVAAASPPFAAVFDVDAPELSSPGQSPSTIHPHLDGTWDGTRGAVVRAILESLVLRLAQRVDEIDRLLGTRRDTIHVVGGACRMAMVMQWLADATGRRVVAGPVEAAALGNAVIQWRTLGAVSDLAAARRLIARMPEITTYEPTGNQALWQGQAARLGSRS